MGNLILGGGFGPVSPDGYGVSYIVAGEDMMFFHVSSAKTCEKTSSENFIKHLCRAFQDMKFLHEQCKREQQQNTAVKN